MFILPWKACCYVPDLRSSCAEIINNSKRFPENLASQINALVTQFGQKWLAQFLSWRLQVHYPLANQQYNTMSFWTISVVYRKFITKQGQKVIIASLCNQGDRNTLTENKYDLHAYGVVVICEHCLRYTHPKYNLWQALRQDDGKPRRRSGTELIQEPVSAQRLCISLRETCRFPSLNLKAL